MSVFSVVISAIILAVLVLKAEGTCTLNGSPGYKFNGNAGRVWGEPHFVLWSGAVHDFQGTTSTAPDGQQYYYITACNGYTYTDIPIQVIGTHTIYPGTTIMTLSALTLVYKQDASTTYYFYIGNGYQKYALASAGGKTYYEPNAAYNMDWPLSGVVGNLFIFSIPLNTGNGRIRVEMTFPGANECTFALEYNFDTNTPTMMDVTIEVPECYRCYICGLLGDFQNTGNNLELCNGTVYAFSPGYLPSSSYPAAYDSNGWTYQLPWYNANCPGAANARRMQVVEEWEVTIPENYTFIDKCDTNTTIYSKAVSLCNELLMNNTDCCNTITSNFCDKLIRVCAYDACVLSTTIDDVDGYVDTLLTLPIQEECAYIDRNGTDSSRYNPDNYELGSFSPTTAPSMSPSMSPSMTPGSSSNAYVTSTFCLYALVTLMVYFL